MTLTKSPEREVGTSDQQKQSVVAESYIAPLRFTQIPEIFKIPEPPKKPTLDDLAMELTSMRQMWAVHEEEIKRIPVLEKEYSDLRSQVGDLKTQVCGLTSQVGDLTDYCHQIIDASKTAIKEAYRDGSLLSGVEGPQDMFQRSGLVTTDQI
jgi:hypothetical protein